MSGRRLRLWWQVQSRRLGRLGHVDLVSRGPVAAEPAELQYWTDCWQRWHRGRPLLLNADGLDTDALRAAGFWPLMTPASVAMLPLGSDEYMRQAMQQKWRNRLNRALRGSMSVTESELTPDHWLLRAEAEQARAKRYRGLPPQLCAAFAAANPGKARVFEAEHRGIPVAGAIVLRHGRMATWQIGVTLDAGRQGNAMNLLLWHAMRSLAADGHDRLDLGILNAQDAAGLTRFKLGTGARVHRLGGTWLHMGVLAPLARRLPPRLQS